jgi:hypothetical protein
VPWWSSSVVVRAVSVPLVVMVLLLVSDQAGRLAG